MAAIQVPYLGICLGMQLAVVEFARNELDLVDANSTEFDQVHPRAGHSTNASCHRPKSSSLFCSRLLPPAVHWHVLLR